MEQKLKSSRKGGDREYLEGAQDIHETDMDFQRRVREMYLVQCSMDEKFIRIDCSDASGRMLPPDEISGKVRAVVDRVLKS